MSVLVSHPTGNTNVRGVLDGLSQAELLETFVTTIATYEGNLFGRLAQTKLGAEFQRRRYAPELAARTRSYPLRELIRLIATRAKWSKLIAHETGAFCTDKIYEHLDLQTAKLLQHEVNKQLKAVYCYEDGAVATFQAAKALGLACIYDLPIGYWRVARSIQTEEAELQPEWAGTMPALRDSTPKLERKDEELQGADAIMVASQFTANTLKTAPFALPEPKIIPYGCPIVTASAPRPETKPADTLKVLFVGGLSQRKGLAYLLEAVEQLGSLVELTLVGRRVNDCVPLDQALETHTWIESQPHAQILETMQAHDVFVFPSLFEGFGLVITEALSQGLPVIATAHTCAPDLIEDGREGFIVPIRDSGAIAEKLELLARDRSQLAAMSQAATATARASTWESYNQSVGNEVAAFLETRN